MKITQNMDYKIPQLKKFKKIDRFNETKLTKVDPIILPSYIKKNINRFKEWIID